MICCFSFYDIVFCQTGAIIKVPSYHKEKKMEKRWLLVVDHYEGIRQNAVDMLSGFVSGLISYVLPIKLVENITQTDLVENNIIAVGSCETHAVLSAYAKKGLLNVPKAAEGYAVYVGKTPETENAQTIAIAGADEKGILYGCMQFMGEYCGDTLYKKGYLWGEKFFENPLERELTEWKVSAVPAVKTRAIWTWGYVIYDYKAFFENMARLRLNEVVIWNDYVPFNAKEVVAYAHSLGIKVIWGFAWGWSTKCAQAIEELCSEDGLKNLKAEVLATYQTQYAQTGGDGIYFQSFTELNEDEINGKCIAEIVTELVNDIASALLEKYPSLHIQFGLHATSVKTHLDILQNVDKRIHIVWEDCGAFPYHYLTDKIEDFDETYAFTQKLLRLRGEKERFGAVLKGMLNLDWGTFQHHTGSYILGAHTKAFIRERQIKKDKIWKIVRGGWLKNAEYMRKTVALIAENGDEPIIQALVEDGMFENKIALPVAIYAQTLWTPNDSIQEIIEKASKNAFVEKE